MKIGELGDQCGVTAKTIRYYESIGLLDEPARTSSGYRDYDQAAAERLEFVKQAQATGLTLDEIGSILQIKDRGGQSCEHTRSLLGRHLDVLDERIEELHRARIELRRMFDRAAALDPSNCDDPNRCQVITDTDTDTRTDTRTEHDSIHDDVADAETVPATGRSTGPSAERRTFAS